MLISRDMNDVLAIIRIIDNIYNRDIVIFVSMFNKKVYVCIILSIRLENVLYQYCG